MTGLPDEIYLFVNEKDKASMRAVTWTEEEFNTPSTKYTRTTHIREIVEVWCGEWGIKGAQKDELLKRLGDMK